jgi:hypothetical protein
MLTAKQDPGDLYEFICDSSVQPGAFEIVSIQCQYERKYKRSHEQATEQELKQFIFTDSPIPPASPVANSPPSSAFTSPVAPAKAPKTATHTPVRKTRQVKEPTPVKSLVAPTAPEATEILCSEDAELHLFDVVSGTFVMQDQDVTSIVSEVGRWQCESGLSPRRRRVY